MEAARFDELARESPKVILAFSKLVIAHFPRDLKIAALIGYHVVVNVDTLTVRVWFQPKPEGEPFWISVSVGTQALSQALQTSIPCNRRSGQSPAAANPSLLLLL